MIIYLYSDIYIGGVMAKKFIRYISLLTPMIFLISVVLNMWCIKDTITDKGFTSHGWGIFGIPDDIMNTDGLRPVWLVIFGICVIISLILSVVLLTIIVLNSFKLTNKYTLEKLIAIALGAVTLQGVIFGIIAIMTNAHLGFMTGIFVETAKLIPMVGFYIYAIGGVIFSALSILGSLLKDATE